MTIHIEDLKFQCVIGILDFERLTPQDVIINLEIIYTFKKDYFINYAEVSKLIEDTMKKQKFLLIEDALTLLSSKLKQTFTSIDTLKLKITKPTIMSNSKVSVSEFFEFNS